MPLADLTADALDTMEPQRVNNILLFIVGLDDHDSVDAPLVLALESFPLPKRSVGVLELGHLNEKRKFAGRPTYDDMQVVYKDFCTQDISAILNEWWQLVCKSDTNGAIGFASQYKKNAYAVSYGPDGTSARQWNIFGIWPSSYDPGDADQEGEDYVRVNMTLTIDKAQVATAAEVAPPAYG